jgi:hypothetical protein
VISRGRIDKPAIRAAEGPAGREDVDGATPRQLSVERSHVGACGSDGRERALEVGLHGRAKGGSSLNHAILGKNEEFRARLGARGDPTRGLVAPLLQGPRPVDRVLGGGDFHLGARGRHSAFIQNCMGLNVSDG